MVLISYLMVGCSQVQEGNPTAEYNPQNRGPNTAVALAVDASNNEIFVANVSNFSITVYGRTGTGNVPPIRKISGPNTGLSYPMGCAVDTVNNQIFVANYGNNSITVYGRTDTGNIAPVRVISGASTGLSYPISIALDTANNEIFLVNQMNITAGGTQTSGSITVYRTTDSGNVSPLRTISMASTSLNYLGGIALDTVNNEIFVGNTASAGNSTGIAVYGRTDTGNVSPVRTISGVNTGLMNIKGIAVDALNNEIIVADLYYRSITVYRRTDTGNVSPVRTINGEMTGLSYPHGVAIDSVNNQIAVVNGYYGNNSITIYGRTDSGNITPVRSISGANTDMF